MLICTKEFTVQGKTSLGGFKCRYDMVTVDTLFFSGSKKASKFTHVIPVKSFGCGNFVLNGDFRKTLNAKEYPEIKIELSNFKKSNNSYSCDVLLNLVGKQKSYKDLKLSLDKGNICGELVLNFSDFELVPPKKLGGMIKVKEEIELNIRLVKGD